MHHISDATPVQNPILVMTVPADALENLSVPDSAVIANTKMDANTYIQLLFS